MNRFWVMKIIVVTLFGWLLIYVGLSAKEKTPSNEKTMVVGPKACQSLQQQKLISGKRGLRGYDADVSQLLVDKAPELSEAHVHLINECLAFLQKKKGRISAGSRFWGYALCNKLVAKKALHNKGFDEKMSLELAQFFLSLEIDLKAEDEKDRRYCAEFLDVRKFSAAISAWRGWKTCRELVRAKRLETKKISAAMDIELSAVMKKGIVRFSGAVVDEIESCANHLHKKGYGHSRRAWKALGITNKEISEMMRRQLNTDYEGLIEKYGEGYKIPPDEWKNMRSLKYQPVM